MQEIKLSELGETKKLSNLSQLSKKCTRLILKRWVRTLGLIILTGSLSSCSVYSGDFNCPDSKGARCTMLSEVDRQVDSGEIETAYFDKKCKGKACKKQQLNKPAKSLDKFNKVKIIPAKDSQDTYQEGDDLYIK